MSEQDAKKTLRTRARDSFYIAVGVIRMLMIAPRQIVKHALSKYSQKKVATELRKFMNLYMASSLLKRILILSLILTFYIIAKELDLNTDLYVAIITVLIGIYSIAILVIGSCMYFAFCIKRKIALNPWKVAYGYTAREIERALAGKSRASKWILRFAFGDTAEFARHVAQSAIYSQEIRKLIYVRLAYYAGIFCAYVLGYNLIYNKLIAIDFHNFIHPFIWSWYYLVNAAG